MNTIAEESAAILKALGGRPQVECGLLDKAGGALLLADDDGLVTCYGSDSRRVFEGREIVVRVTADRIVISCGAESVEINATL